MNEANRMRAIMAGVSRPGVRVFRQNVGTGWAGKATRITQSTTVRLNPGDVVIRAARPLHAGLCKGSSDLIGWRSVEVTPDMVGKRHALFLAIECKSERGKASDEQQNFIDRVRADGGLAGIARTPDDALLITNQ
jgi:hypothetical protein